MTNARIRITLMTDHFGDDGTSGGLLMQDVARAWSAAGFGVYVITQVPQGMGSVPSVRDAGDGSLLVERRVAPADRHVSLVRRTVRESRFCLWATWRFVRRRPRPSILFILSSPALLPTFAAVAAGWRRVPYVVVEMDVFPDNMVALGLLRSDSLLVRMLRGVYRWTLRGARRVVVMGSCMETLVRQRYVGDDRKERLVTVQNWADGTRIVPTPKEDSALYAYHPEVHGKFIVQFFGNLGRLQEFDTMLAAAGLLRNDGVVFVLMGTGSETASLKTRIEKMRLPNVLMWGPVSSVDQRDALACCDIALVTLREAALGVGVPSKLYPTMAMGRPVVAVVPDLSETATTVREGRFGYVVAPGHPQELASALMSLKNDVQLRIDMGQRAREMFEQRFDKPIGTARYVRLVEEAIRG